MPFDQHWLLACVAPRALLGPRLGYYRRGGRHGLSAYDWAWALDFAERAFMHPDFVDSVDCVDCVDRPPCGGRRPRWRPETSLELNRARW